MKHFLFSSLLIALPLLSTAENSGLDDSWRQFDKNGDSALNLEEFSQLRITQYAALDRNGDGIWTKKEFVQRAPDMTIGRIDSLRQKFNRWDLDKDGQWVTSEAAQAIKGNFKWLDKNKNGELTIKEFPRYW